MKELEGKICIVTGANAGIGFVTARELARKGAQIVMVCRNQQKGEVAREQLIRKTGNTNIDLLLADFSSQAQTRAVAEKIAAQYPQIDVLVNNAGIITDERQLTEDGIEYTFAVNHLGYFLLTNLLLPQIEKAPAGRIVNVSSEAHRFAKMKFTDLNLEKDYSNLKAYCLSKLANIMFTTELSKRLADSTVTANCLHPGAVASNFGNTTSGFFKAIVKLSRPFMISSEKGAQTSIYLASSPEVANMSGLYFDKKKAKRPSAQATNPEDCRRLWKISAELTNIEV